jgi:hypothetical protein
VVSSAAKSETVRCKNKHSPLQKIHVLHYVIVIFVSTRAPVGINHTDMFSRRFYRIMTCCMHFRFKRLYAFSLQEILHCPSNSVVSTHTGATSKDIAIAFVAPKSHHGTHYHRLPPVSWRAPSARYRYVQATPDHYRCPVMLQTCDNSDTSTTVLLSSPSLEQQVR